MADNVTIQKDGAQPSALPISVSFKLTVLRFCGGFLLAYIALVAVLVALVGFVSPYSSAAFIGLAVLGFKVFDRIAMMSLGHKPEAISDVARNLIERKTNE